MIKISAIVCTHNPDRVRLRRVISSIKTQTLPPSDWELIVVDNASTEPVVFPEENLLHINKKIVRENQLGLTWARLRGLKESVGDILIFIDDDNILRKDFFEMALEIDKEWPILGAWGGEIIPEYESELPGELKPYESLLAVLEVRTDTWCNFINTNCIPRGAGLVARKSVVEHYGKKVLQSDLRQCLERQGTDLASCGDSDLCFSAFDLGFGLGTFKKLQVVHVIPTQRTKIEYLLRLEESMSFSWTILNFIHKKHEFFRNRGVLGLIADLLRWTFADAVRKKFLLKGMIGRSRAFKLLKKHKKTF